MYFLRRAVLTKQNQVDPFEFCLQRLFFILEHHAVWLKKRLNLNSLYQEKDEVKVCSKSSQLVNNTSVLMFGVTFESPDVI